MKILSAVPAALCIIVSGCATAPKAIRIDAESAADKIGQAGVVTYMLPKSSFAVSATWEKRTYVEGPLTKELKKWLSDGAKQCRPTDAFDPDSICAWGLKPAKTPPLNTVLQCDTDKDSVVSLVRTTDPVLSVTPSWDTSRHFAIELGKQAFQSTELQLEYSPFGTLGGYSAKSTSLIAETLEKIATEAVAQPFSDEVDDGNPPTTTFAQRRAECKKWPGLCRLVEELAKLEKSRRLILTSSDPKGASALIDDQIKALRGLAEGVERTGPFSIRIGIEPDSRTWAEERQAVTPAISKPAEDAKLAEKLGCATSIAEATLSLALSTARAEEEALFRVAGRNNVTSPALYYRLPLPATPSLKITCSGAGIPEGARCLGDGFNTGFPSVMVPQWGRTLALPRSLGWRSGALGAKLDPNTGALTNVSASSQGSLEGSILNGLYAADAARRAAELAAAAKDTERAQLERERILLEEQVKICAARRALGQAPGDECPK